MSQRWLSFEAVYQFRNLITEKADAWGPVRSLLNVFSKFFVRPLRRSCLHWGILTGLARNSASSGAQGLAHPNHVTNGLLLRSLLLWPLEHAALEIQGEGSAVSGSSLAPKIIRTKKLQLVFFLGSQWAEWSSYLDIGLFKKIYVLLTPPPSRSLEKFENIAWKYKERKGNIYFSHSKATMLILWCAFVLIPSPTLPCNNIFSMFMIKV